MGNRLYKLGNANPGAFLKPRVCGFDGLQTRVPGYPGLYNYVSPVAGPC